MQRRIFVCTNQKSGVGEDVAKALKKELKIQGVKKLLLHGEKLHTRVQTCNCLDLCKHCKKGPGAALIIYPEAEAFGKVQPKDAADFVRYLAGEATRPGQFLDNES
ncbi:(2Fe-2S) ferredoxin domain-containing protein [Hymenobacter psoromatis]|uniref:(2Fe-2S) ferredoxin domain-containing protein n=1 Tax=Hymenobacter psoromatis TaxID=1484116 RepID=UPI001CC160C6|nr:(2Fe-2S) ferredoxin domain-containing protein [Hymenobacter psoromatis]